MGGIGRAIGAVLTGVGDGMEKQATLDYQTRRDDLANARAIALENLRHEYKGQEQTAQYDLSDRNAARDDARGFSYGTQTKAQEHGQRVEEITLKGNIDLSNDKAIEEVKNTYQLGQIQAKALADYQHDALLNHTTPDHYEKTTDGRIVIWNKDGSTRGALGPDGQFIPSGASESTSHSDDGEGGTISDTIAARGGGGGEPATGQPQPKSKPPAQASSGSANIKGQALARLPGLYMQIRQDPAKYRQQYPGMFDANGNLLPIDQLKDRINQRYGG